MTLKTGEFIRRFLLHVLPSGFHRIRHYGFFANRGRTQHLGRLRKMMISPANDDEAAEEEPTQTVVYVCRACGETMAIIETIAPEPVARAPPRLSA